MIPAMGTSWQTSNLNTLFNDFLNGMGDYFSQEIGSLNWCECLSEARQFEAAYNLINLMGRQLNPDTASVWLDRWANIYNISSLANISNIQNYIQITQSLFGTPPNTSNVKNYLSQVLDSIFINLDFNPENQYLATINGYQQTIIDGYLYNMPLSRLFVYVWQPRDNQDNLLMPNNRFVQLVDNYYQTLQNWLPHFSEIITENLVNRGNQDGYGGGYNGFNYNNYLDGYNVVNIAAGNTILSGTNTTFTQDFFPQSAYTSSVPYSLAITPPIQIVDNLGVLQTYYVASIIDDSGLILTSPVINNITARTYRTLGIVCDTDGMLDYGSLFNH